MASSTASRLLSFGGNNSAIRSVIQRRLLLPTAAAITPSITQLSDPIAEQQTAYLKPTQNSTCTTEVSDKMKNPIADNSIACFYPFGMVGLPGGDQSGTLQARRGDSDGSHGFVSETELEDGDEDFESDDDDDDIEETDDAFDEEEEEGDDRSE